MLLFFGSLNQTSLLHGSAHQHSQLGRALGDNNTGVLQGLDLVLGTTLASGNNGSSVTHASAGRGRKSSNERDNRLGLLAGQVELLQELGGLLLGAASDLSNEDNTLSVGVLQEDGQAVDEVGSVEGITTNTDAEGLAKTDLGGLVDSLVGKSTGTGDDT